MAIVMVSLALGICFNHMRASGIPLTGSRTAQAPNNDTDPLIISLADAKIAFEENKALFLDARDERSFSQGHIQGAQNLPWHQVDDYLMAVIKGLSRQTPIIAYCDGEACNLSHELAVLLKELGFSKTRVLVNGWTVWQAAGLPVARGAGNQVQSGDLK